MSIMDKRRKRFGLGKSRRKINLDEMKKDIVDLSKDFKTYGIGREESMAIPVLDLSIVDVIEKTIKPIWSSLDGLTVKVKEMEEKKEGGRKADE